MYNVGGLAGGLKSTSPTPANGQINQTEPGTELFLGSHLSIYLFIYLSFSPSLSLSLSLSICKLSKNFNASLHEYNEKNKSPKGGGVDLEGAYGNDPCRFQLIRHILALTKNGVNHYLVCYRHRLIDR